jgi:Putative phage tail protein
MPVFTLAATAVLAEFAITSTTAIAFLAAGMQVAVAIGISYVAKALAGQPEQEADSVGVKLNLQAGGDLPRSFGLGYHVTAGSLVYANTWGQVGETPNAHLTQVIALSDLPGERLLRMWVNNEPVTFPVPLLTSDGDATMGIACDQYQGSVDPAKFPPYDHLWVKFYDGTQTLADPFVISKASAERPYTSTRVGKGVCYAVVTALANDKVWSGIPSFLFEMSGIKLYDPSKDSTVGGSGSHVYSNPATWGGDGDDLPAVQIYNILRGIRYDSAWVYGLQNMTAPRLPVANWIEQINKCRATITGTSGLEPTYRSGAEVSYDAQPGYAVEAFLTACQGRLSEIGGSYKIKLGAPDASAFSWTDDDLISTEEQTFRPFYSLADSINGIQGSYPDPQQSWNSATAPALYRTDLEIKDGNRRLMAALSFDAVPYPAQVQRLQKSGIEEAQRARTHTITLPPPYWIVEPGDFGQWTSARNGYSSKLFRVDSVTDKANLDIVANVTEVDPADYSWDHATEFKPTTTGPTAFLVPTAQAVADWTATGTYLIDDNGITRRPAILITWDNSLFEIAGISYEIRLALDLSPVARGRSDQYAEGDLIITQGLVGLTTYQIRMRYIPTSPRETLWSDWITVVTPDVTLSIADFDAALKAQVTLIQDQMNDKIDQLTQLIASLASNDMATNWLDKQRSSTEISASVGPAVARVSTLEIAQVNASAAFASYQTEVSAQFGTTNANVSTNSTAIATLNDYAAAQYSVTLNVNGYATGFELINGGSGTSAFTVVSDKFQVQQPGADGGIPKPVFTIGTNAAGTAIGISGNMYLDGTIYARQMVTGTIDAASGVIAALAVKSLQIADYAVVVPAAETRSDTFGTMSFTEVSSVTLSFDTTGLSGKSLTIIAGFVGSVSYTGAAGPVVRLKIDGNIIQSALAGTSQVQFLSLTGSHTFSAAGGSESKVVSVEWQSGANAILGARTLWAMVGKR